LARSRPRSTWIESACNGRSFRPDREMKQARNGLPPFPPPGTKPYLIPYGSIPAHSRSRGASGAGGGRRGTSPTGTATTSHFSSAVSAAFSPVSRQLLLFSPSRVSWFRWPVGHGAGRVRAGGDVAGAVAALRALLSFGFHPM
jgi:hypothetical protein